jgi:hypothetical protein
MTNEFLGKRDHCNVFEFVCPRCGVDGELGIPEGCRTLTACPEKCGALFIVTLGSGMFARPTLVAVNDSNEKERAA